MNPSSPEVNTQLSNLILVSWILLIPVGILLCVVLYKIYCLFHDASDFLVIAKHELGPTLQDVRKTASHVEGITAKAADSADAIQQGVQSIRPALDKTVTQGAEQLRNISGSIKDSLLAVAGGIRASFNKK